MVLSLVEGIVGGEGEIRTHGTREGTTVFETAPFGHSGTSPRGSGLEAGATLAKPGPGRNPAVAEDLQSSPGSLKK